MGDHERSAVEAYIKHHGVQGLLDDLVDRVVTAKPADPLEYMVGFLREKMQSGITSVKARAIFGAGAALTVEVEVETRAGVCTASAPAGDSSHPARDYEARRVEANEASVSEAVAIINEQIAPRLLGCDPTDQRAMDELLMPVRAELGANAMIAVSMAICRAGARAKDVSLFRHIAELAGNHEELVLPVPVVTALSAGQRAGSASAALPFREFLLLPTGASSVREALSMCNAVANAVKVTLTGGVAGAPIGDEGTPALEDAVPRYELLSSASGSAAVPANVTTAQQTFDLLRGCMGQLGLVDKIRLGVNASAQDFATTFSAGGITEGEDAMDASHLPVIYKLAGPDEEGSDVEELTAVYRECIERFSVAYIEDPFTFSGEGTTEGWAALTEEVGRDVAVVGCELIASSTAMLGESIDSRACNTVTLQPGRIGTVTDIIALCDIAQKEQWAVCIASDAGDTSDGYLADLAVGVKAGMLRAGAVEHGQHVGKYNQLLRIEEELSAAGGAEYVGDRFRDPL